jgi:hypothetical protein
LVVISAQNRTPGAATATCRDFHRPAQPGSGRSAARLVLDCIERLAAQDTNPVLELLKTEPQFVQGRKYPQPALAFGGGRWRAYYHSHPLDGCADREHGHFHLFVGQDSASTDARRAHVTALAMDCEGQPLRWFATNRWVTGGPWGEAAALLCAIETLEPADEQELLPRWLAAMLKLHATELGRLLERRDACFARHRRSHRERDSCNDRSLYELAQVPIDLLAILTSRLTGDCS